MAKESLTYCEEAQQELKKWDGMIKELRGNVLRQQGGTQRPSAPVAPVPLVPTPSYPEPDPVVSILNFAAVDVSCGPHRPTLAHAYWVIAPSVEACLRRFYKCLTSGGDRPDWVLLQSQVGVTYLDALLSKFESNEPHLSSYRDYHYLNLLKPHFSGSLTVIPPPPDHPILRSLTPQAPTHINQSWKGCPQSEHHSHEGPGVRCLGFRARVVPSRLVHPAGIDLESCGHYGQPLLCSSCCFPLCCLMLTTTDRNWSDSATPFPHRYRHNHNHQATT